MTVNFTLFEYEIWQTFVHMYWPQCLCPLNQVQQILTYEDSVAAHLSKILTSDQHSVVISSAKYVWLSVCLTVCRCWSHSLTDCMCVCVCGCIQGSVWDGEGLCGSCWQSVREEHREFRGVGVHGQEGTFLLFFYLHISDWWLGVIIFHQILIHHQISQHLKVT